ncbi:hypothetical protein NQ317_012109 [Molorchus minor]|uniref:DDE Tnp4 domain-containing protein n=1 Tax=Molorchus minor TaxID=1323400 RepID=A0ABQ9J1H7_9CUCU|nr:hypothetical protein NQ317_012109 [Molorchus minor]
MSPEIFEDLLKLVGPKLKKSYLIREPIAPSIRLAVTLRYLASGDSMVSIAYAFRVGINTVSNIISETCLAIWECLHDKVLLKPNEEAWKQIASGFEGWNFPNCLGAIDGKHVIMQAQTNSGSTYYNYKGCHSVVLLALCDASYCFTLVDIGAYGTQSDGGVLRNSTIGKLFHQEAMKIPPPKEVPNGPVLPYVVISYEAFALTTYMLRPYPRNALNHMRKARQYFSLDENILKQPAGAFLDVRRIGSNNFSRSAAQIRELFTNYFFNEGAVDFQVA